MIFVNIELSKQGHLKSRFVSEHESRHSVTKVLSDRREHFWWQLNELAFSMNFYDSGCFDLRLRLVHKVVEVRRSKHMLYCVHLLSLLMVRVDRTGGLLIIKARLVSQGQLEHVVADLLICLLQVYRLHLNLCNTYHTLLFVYRQSFHVFFFVLPGLRGHFFGWWFFERTAACQSVCVRS